MAVGKTAYLVMKKFIFFDEKKKQKFVKILFSHVMLSQESKLRGKKKKKKIRVNGMERTKIDREKEN